MNIWKVIWFIVIWITVILFIFIWFYSSWKNFINSKIYIDNPTEKEIVVQIDNLEEIKIWANSSIEIELKSGIHSLTVDNESVWEFEKPKKSHKWFLNPTKSKYILEEAIYLVDEDVELPNDVREIIIDDEIYPWPFILYDDYYIIWDWNYNLDTDAPKEVMTDSEAYTIIKKIYRKKDFIDMYEQDYYY